MKRNGTSGFVVYFRFSYGVPHLVVGSHFHGWSAQVPMMLATRGSDRCVRPQLFAYQATLESQNWLCTTFQCKQVPPSRTVSVWQKSPLLQQALEPASGKGQSFTTSRHQIVWTLLWRRNPCYEMQFMQFGIAVTSLCLGSEPVYVFFLG